MEGESRSTIYDILHRKKSEKPAERKVGSGRPAKKMNGKAVKRLVNSINHKDGVSQRRLAQVFKFSQPIYAKRLKTRQKFNIEKKLRLQKELPFKKQLFV